MTAVIVPVERGARGEFSPTKISASRVDKYLGCGVEFKRDYIEHEPKGGSGSAALFGNVMHAAMEKWALDRSKSLVTYTAQAWLEIARGTPIAEFIGEYQAISVECIKAEAAARIAWEARNKGKESKAPRMTREFKESPAAKKLNRLLGKWFDRLNSNPDYKFSERDPLPSLYDESLILAKRYSDKYRDSPPALFTEFGFNVEYEGFLLHGFIDVIEPVGTQGYVVGDYKTYRQEAPKAKDWRQGVLYDIAVRSLIKSGQLDLDPEKKIWVVFDYMRLLKRRDFIMGEADYAVFLDDLKMYRDGVTAGVFLPAQKNRNPEFCDYNETCCLRTRGEGTGCAGGLYPQEDS